jgi:hypothetical protein
MIREGSEFEDLDYPDEEEGIEKLKDAKVNFIIWPRKHIIIKTRSSLIISPKSREDEGTPTSQNTIRNTATFTPPYENHPETPPPPKNLTSTQPLEHHSPPHGHSSKSPHTTPPLQNLLTEQAPQQHSPPHVHSLKSPHTTPPLQNPSTKQAPQQHSPPHVHSPKSPPHTTLSSKSIN